MTAPFSARHSHVRRAMIGCGTASVSAPPASGSPSATSRPPSSARNWSGLGDAPASSTSQARGAGRSMPRSCRHAPLPVIRATAMAHATPPVYFGGARPSPAAGGASPRSHGSGGAGRAAARRALSRQCDRGPHGPRLLPRGSAGVGWDDSEVVPPGSSLVEIDLIEQPDGTLMRLTHTGLPNAEQCASHAEGWVHYFGRLAEVAAGRDPGPDPWHGRTG